MRQFDLWLCRKRTSTSQRIIIFCKRKVKAVFPFTTCHHLNIMSMFSSNNMQSLILGSVMSLAMINNVAMFVVPSKMLDVYQYPSENAQIIRLMRSMGCAGTAAQVMALSLLAMPDTITTTVAHGLAELCWVGFALHGLYTYDEKKFPLKYAFPLVKSSITAYLCLATPASAAAFLAARLNGYFCVLFGITSVVAPDLNAASVGGTPLKNDKLNAEEEVRVQHSMYSLGYYLLGLGTLIVALTDYGMNTAQAIGASWIWVVAMTVAPVVRKSKRSAHLVRCLPWLLPHAALLTAAFWL